MYFFSKAFIFLDKTKEELCIIFSIVSLFWFRPSLAVLYNLGKLLSRIYESNELLIEMWYLINRHLEIGAYLNVILLAELL